MKRICFLIGGLFSYLIISSQPKVYLNAATHNTTQTGCSFWFYDDGTETSNYTNNQDRWITFASSNPVNTHIRLEFAAFDIANDDTLFIYDGPSISSPLIGWYNNSHPLTNPNTVVQASIYNTSGKLTIRFKSNNVNNRSGWNAAVSCIPQCQTVIAAVDTLEMIPLPDDSNYINICAGTPIKFAALGAGPGAFPQNDILYHQDSTTSTYHWDFGDGTQANGRVVWHTYPVTGGYTVYLTVTDVRGCTNTQLLQLRVRIADNPIAHLTPLPHICEGDTIYIHSGMGPGNQIVINPTNSNIVISESYDSTTFIPDGPNCPQTCYQTPVTFTSFPPGSTIQNASDILAICINMEHTFAGDLSFRIICPNGQSVLLDSYDNSGGNDLGQANYNDNSTFPCNASLNPPGTGWLYCWSQIYPQQGLLNTLDGSGPTPIPPTDTVNHTNYITPQNPLSGLVGCPLNGTWSIEICDNWAIDNGYVFWWGLTLSNTSSSGGWSYYVEIDSVIYYGPFIYQIDDTTARVVPQSPGTYNYTVVVYDEYGCSWDTTITLQVVDVPDVNLGNDTILCDGQTLTLSAPNAQYYFWNTGSLNQSIQVNQTGFYSVTAVNETSQVTCFDSDEIFVEFYPNASVNLGNDTCALSGPILLDAGNPGFRYQWSTGDTSQILQINSYGSHEYWVRVGYGPNYMCGDKDTIRVTIIPSAQVSLVSDEICPFQQKQYDVTQNLPYYRYIWSSGDTTPKIIIQIPDPGVYHYTVQIIGCDTITDSTTVTVLDCGIMIPNIITPENKDGFNDVFRIVNIEHYPNSHLWIYNRWGKKVFESSNYHNEFDGENLPSGTYYYILRLNYNNGKTEDYQGTITILR
ncbi:MAG: gliding motility-associated C-terminal domain-containing protein [Bacteroidales bacterium]|nr:gliding motility-associated C-terminal domain-containing protein [Bacteroidales bacterium]